MTNGVINGNRVTHSIFPNPLSEYYANGAYGGGVELDIVSYTLFEKTGGIIFGDDVNGNDADGFSLKNTAQSDSSGKSGGHAVFINDDGLGLMEKLRRNTTAHETNNLNSGKTSFLGGWE